MFDVGFSELLIIAVVALIVLGPERLPKAARFAGLWVRKARSQWYAVKSELEFELAQEEMKKHLQDVENSIKAPVLELQDNLQQAQAEIENTVSLEFEAEPHAPQVAEPAESHSTDDVLELKPLQDANIDPAPAAEHAVEADESVPDPKQGALW